MRELESRETQFRAVQDKGESLVMERHPAAKVIEVRLVDHRHIFDIKWVAQG